MPATTLAEPERQQQAASMEAMLQAMMTQMSSGNSGGRSDGVGGGRRSVCPRGGGRGAAGGHPGRASPRSAKPIARWQRPSIRSFGFGWC